MEKTLYNTEGCVDCKSTYYWTERFFFAKLSNTEKKAFINLLNFTS